MTATNMKMRSEKFPQVNLEAMMTGGRVPNICAYCVGIWIQIHRDLKKSEVLNETDCIDSEQRLSNVQGASSLRMGSHDLTFISELHSSNVDHQHGTIQGNQSTDQSLMDSRAAKDTINNPIMFVTQDLALKLGWEDMSQAHAFFLRLQLMGGQSINETLMSLASEEEKVLQEGLRELNSIAHFFKSLGDVSDADLLIDRGLPDQLVCLSRAMDPEAAAEFGTYVRFMLGVKHEDLGVGEDKNDAIKLNLQRESEQLDIVNQTRTPSSELASKFTYLSVILRVISGVIRRDGYAPKDYEKLVINSMNLLPIIIFGPVSLLNEVGEIDDKEMKETMLQYEGFIEFLAHMKGEVSGQQPRIVIALSIFNVSLLKAIAASRLADMTSSDHIFKVDEKWQSESSIGLSMLKVLSPEYSGLYKDTIQDVYYPGQVVKTCDLTAKNFTSFGFTHPLLLKKLARQILQHEVDPANALLDMSRVNFVIVGMCQFLNNIPEIIKDDLSREEYNKLYSIGTSFNGAGGLLYQIPHCVISSDFVSGVKHQYSMIEKTVEGIVTRGVKYGEGYTKEVRAHMVLECFVATKELIMDITSCPFVAGSLDRVVKLSADVANAGKASKMLSKEIQESMEQLCGFYRWLEERSKQEMQRSDLHKIDKRIIDQYLIYIRNTEKCVREFFGKNADKLEPDNPQHRYLKSSIIAIVERLQYLLEVNEGNSHFTAEYYSNRQIDERYFEGKAYDKDDARLLIDKGESQKLQRVLRMGLIGQAMKDVGIPLQIMDELEMHMQSELRLTVSELVALMRKYVPLNEQDDFVATVISRLYRYNSANPNPQDITHMLDRADAVVQERDVAPLSIALSQRAQLMSIANDTAPSEMNEKKLDARGSEQSVNFTVDGNAGVNINRLSNVLAQLGRGDLIGKFVDDSIRGRTDGFICEHLRTCGLQHRWEDLREALKIRRTIDLVFVMNAVEKLLSEKEVEKLWFYLQPKDAYKFMSYVFGTYRFNDSSKEITAFDVFHTISLLRSLRDNGYFADSIVPQGVKMLFDRSTISLIEEALMKFWGLLVQGGEREKIKISIGQSYADQVEIVITPEILHEIGESLRDLEGCRIDKASAQKGIDIAQSAQI